MTTTTQHPRPWRARRAAAERAYWLAYAEQMRMYGATFTGGPS